MPFYYNRSSATSYGDVVNAADYLTMDGSLTGVGGTDNTSALVAAWDAVATSSTVEHLVLPKGIAVTRSAAVLSLPTAKRRVFVWADGFQHVYDNQDPAPGRPIRVLGDGTARSEVNWYGGRTRISRGARRIANLDQISFDHIDITRVYGLTVETAENMGLTFNRGIVDTWIPREIVAKEIRIGGYLSEYGTTHTYGSIGDTGFNLWCPAMDTLVSDVRGGSTGDDFFFIGHSSLWDNAGVRRRISIDNVHGRNVINGIGINCPDVEISNSSIINVMVCGLRMCADNLEGATSSPTGVGASRSKATNIKIEKHGYLTAADLDASSLLTASTTQAAIQISGNDIEVKNSMVDWCTNEAFKVMAAIDGTTTQNNLRSINNVFKRVQFDSAGVRKAQATSRGVISRGPATTSTHFVTDFISVGDRVVDTNAIPLLWDAGNSTGDDRISVIDMVLDNVGLTGTTISAVRVVANTTGRAKNVEASFILANGTTIGRMAQTSGGSTNRDDVRVTEVITRDVTNTANRVTNRYFPGVFHGVTGTRDSRVAGFQDLGYLYQRADADDNILAQFDSSYNYIIESWAVSTSGTHTNVGGAYLYARWIYLATGNVIIPIDPTPTIGAAGYQLVLTHNAGNTTMGSSGTLELSANVTVGPWAGQMGVVTRATLFHTSSYGELLT